MSSYNFILTEVFKKDGADDYSNLKTNSISIYEEGHKNCGLKVGDKVRVVRRAESHEAGWGNTWAGGVSIYVNLIGTIKDDWGNDGFVIYFNDDNNQRFCFPYFVLEKVD